MTRLGLEKTGSHGEILTEGTRKAAEIRKKSGDRNIQARPERLCVDKFAAIEIKNHLIATNKASCDLLSPERAVKNSEGDLAHVFEVQNEQKKKLLIKGGDAAVVLLARSALHNYNALLELNENRPLNQSAAVLKILLQDSINRPGGDQ